MRKLLSSLALSAAAVASLVLGGGMGVANASPATHTGAATQSTQVSPATAMTTACGTGYVCIYQGDIWDGSPNHPILARYYNYGVYNLSNIVGDDTVVNCQTGGAGVAAYSGYNATGSVLWNLNINNCSTGLWTDMTPVNSVRLYA